VNSRKSVLKYLFGNRKRSPSPMFSPPGEEITNGAWLLFGSVFDPRYGGALSAEDLAPLGLDSISVLGLQRCRAYGAGRRRVEPVLFGVFRGPSRGATLRGKFFSAACPANPPRALPTKQGM
jgi:hypothetical protein